jgi:arylsulfatase A-like enzyme
MRLSRRRLSACLLLLLACSNGRPTVAADRPNVLIVITDDQGYGDFSIHGNPHVRTPHIDGLGERSVRFDRFFVNSFCSPTRAALLTGRWPLRTGTHGVTHNREAMRPSEVTIAEALRPVGYRTGCFGKWHNGEQFPYTPTGQGFDEFFGFHNGHFNDYFDPVLLRGTQPVETRGYITDVLTDEALAFIDRAGDQPFCCYLAYNAPHSPYQVPDKYFDRFQALGFNERLSAFYGMCESVDDNVGRLLARLEQRGLRENTIVVFLTDNGGTAGVKTYNAGMRGGKTSVHEGGSRVPLFVSWPAAGWKPHVVETIASHIDVYPTLVDLCGVTAPAGPAVDGRSLRPLLEGREGEWPERVLFTHNPIDETNRYPGAVRTQRYRLVREVVGKGGGSASVNRDETAKPWQLYDMQADPSQERDLAKEEPQVVADLSRQYEVWFDDIARDGVQRPPVPIGYLEENPVLVYAPQAYYNGPMHFLAGPGYAHDWLTGWTDLRDKAWFELDVHTAGRYRIDLGCTCPPQDAGVRLKVSVGDSAFEVDVPVADVVNLPLPHRDAEGHERYLNRNWPTVAVGTAKLPAGPATLTIEALAKPGEQVVDLKHVRLELLDGQ